jgi:hypothetical protein
MIPVPRLFVVTAVMSGTIVIRMSHTLASENRGAMLARTMSAAAHQRVDRKHQARQ